MRLEKISQVLRLVAAPVYRPLLLLVIGVVLLLSTAGGSPASQPVSSQAAAATGQVVGSAATVTDADAMNGQAVQFGAGPTPSADGFSHPGVLLDTSQLDFAKSKIAAGAEPWTSAYNNMMNLGTGTGGRFSSLTYKDQPVPVVKCVAGGGNHNLDVGCQPFKDDMIAAYTDSLVWYYTGNSAYAQKSVSIMNDWSAVLQSVAFDSTYSNGLLVAGWSGETVTKAAEIIRSSYSGWASSDIQRFSSMLTNVYLPNVNHGWTGGAPNWLMTLADATIDIGVFTGNRDAFNLGVSQWRAELPAMIYQSTDVNPYPQLAGYPIPPPGTIYDSATTTKAKMNTYWSNPSQYVDGLEGETCRDMTHTTMGLDAMVDAAETARLQGVDLYRGNTARMVSGYEFNARYFSQMLATGSVPSSLCGGSIATGASLYLLGWEVGYNALHDRLGIDMPYTQAFINTYPRTQTYKASLFMDWEQLTHGNSTPTCASPDRSLGVDTLSTSVSAAGSYRVWVRVKAASATDTAFALQIDGNCAINAGGSAMAPGTWTWVSYQNADPTSTITTSLLAGQHSITLTGKSPSLAVDSVLLTDDPGCTPVDDGSACQSDTRAPVTPDNLRVTDTTAHGADLSWDAANDDVGVDHYELSRDGDVIASTPSTSFSDSNLAAATTYGYTVTAVDAAGNTSLPSPAVNITTLASASVDTQPPSTPKGLTATAVTISGATLVWNESTDDVGVVHYVVTRDGSVVGQVSGPSFSDSGLIANKNYTYTVAATDAEGNTSAQSDPVLVATTDTTAPSAPLNPSAVATSGTSAGVSWNAATDDVGVDHYIISRNGSVVGQSSTLTFADSGLLPAATYSYRVVAVDVAGNASAASVGAMVVTPDTVAPTVPAGLKVDGVTPTSVSLGWSAATDNVGVVGYEVYRGGSLVGSTTGLGYTDPVLTASTAYTYTVLAVDAAGNRSLPSMSTNAVTATPPDSTSPTSPTTFTVKATALGQVTLNWSAATDNIKVTSYNVTRGATTIATPTGTTLTYVDSGLSPHTPYTYAVTALDAAGNVSTPKSATITTPSDAAPRGAGFAGAYFNNTTLSGPAIGRLDPTINFAWGSAAPLAGINTTNYSARWTGTLTPTKTGSYTFYTQTHDGVRLYLNDTLLIDHWTAGGGSFNKVTSLTMGTTYRLRMEYYQTTGASAASLQWSGPSITKAVLPSTVMNSGSNGLSASYFANNALTGSPTVQRLDSTINFAWAQAAPDSRLPADDFSVRWVGKITIPTTGSYTFYTDSDDGIRMWINGVQVINNWTAHALATNTSTKYSLTAGTTYDIKVEYYDHANSATARLYWSYGTVAKTIIPTNVLRDR